MTDFQPDYRNVELAARNQRAPRLPLYEHLIDIPKMEEITGRPFAGLAGGDDADMREFLRRYAEFFRDMGYDTVSFECCVTGVIAGGQALMGRRPGDIQCRADFERYPFAELPRRFFDRYAREFRLLGEVLPPGMKAVGGVGNGVFEVAEDLVGYERLCLMSADDPQLYADLFVKIGDVLGQIWQRFLAEYGRSFAVCRFGDDLGFKSSTLLSPQDIRRHILPTYQRIVALVHQHGKPFLLHSCGCIFAVMEDLINVVHIDAKHSNEDAIAPFGRWVELYGDRIGNFGGVDLDVLCQGDEQTIRQAVREVIRSAEGHGGLACGSGNSIPVYCPAAGYLAMTNAVRRYRGDFGEGPGQ